MQNCTQSQKWNKKTSIVTALVAIVGMTSIMYTANNFTDEQFVSAITSKNLFKSNTDANIYPWKIQNSETLDVVSQVVQAKNKISELDEEILTNIRSGVSDATIFEQKGDLLVSIGQYDAAITHYEEALDIQFDQKVEEKLLKAKTALNRITMIQAN